MTPPGLTTCTSNRNWKRNAIRKKDPATRNEQYFDVNPGSERHNSSAAKKSHLNAISPHARDDSYVKYRHGIVQNILSAQQGTNTWTTTHRPFQSALLGLASRLRPYKTISQFDRRVTALAWHPTLSHVLAAGSKGGEIICWDFEQHSGAQGTIPGVGPGGSITSMQFHKEKLAFIYTSSITGKVMLQDFEGRNVQCFLDTLSWDNWFSSLDVQYDRKLLVTGDTKGSLYLLSSKDGTLVWKEPKKIHKAKITHVEFHPLHPDLLVTASIDHTVKLWDMRKLDSKGDALCQLSHNKGVNAAHFNPSNGSLLLTTDQHSELKIFRGPFWQSHTTIPHPHRQFQHLTPIKASWHPCVDTIVVGRYPDDNFKRFDKRSVDFYDGVSGELRYQLSDSSIPGIISLNQFNLTGETLASGMGFHVVVWKAKDEEEGFYLKTSNTQACKGQKENKRSKTHSTTKMKPKIKIKGKLK